MWSYVYNEKNAEVSQLANYGPEGLVPSSVSFSNQTGGVLYKCTDTYTKELKDEKYIVFGGGVLFNKQLLSRRLEV